MKPFKKKFLNTIKGLRKYKTHMSLFSLCIVLFVIFFFLHATKDVSRLTESDVKMLFVNCGKSPGWRGCYSNKFQQLTQHHSLEYVLSVLTRLQNKDLKTRDCHVIAHRIITTEMQKDPMQWRRLLIKLPLLACNYGYIHGIIEGRSRYDTNFILDTKTIPEICESFANKNDRATELTCIHIIGHSLLVQEKGDIKKAVKQCAKLSSNFHYDCYSGVFMENFTRDNLVIHGLATYVPWTEEFVRSQEKLCNEYLSLAAKGCWFVIATLYHRLAPYNPQKVFEYCSHAPNREFQDACYHLGISNLSQKESVTDTYFVSLCEVYSDETRKNGCVHTIAQSLIQASTRYISRVLHYCKIIDSVFKKTCYDALVEYIRPRLTENEFSKLCKSIPPTYQKSCIKPLSILLSQKIAGG